MNYISNSVFQSSMIRARSEAESIERVLEMGHGIDELFRIRDLLFLARLTKDSTVCCVIRA